MTVTNDWLAQQFEAHRGHLRRVAYRMLGSLGEAEDAVQETWLRLASCDAEGIGNLGGWMTTIVSRRCLDMLRARKARPEDSIEDRSADAAVAIDPQANPEDEAQLANSVGLALLVVLETLEPPERLAFVLHDMFDLSFEEIGSILGRTPAAARQLASRARRRVRGTSEQDASRMGRRREIVDAFIAALRMGDIEGLVAVLHPDVVFRIDVPGQLGAKAEVRGARAWAKGAVAYAQLAPSLHPALVSGNVGLVYAPRGRLQRALVFEFDDADRIRAAHIVADPVGLAALDIATLP